MFLLILLCLHISNIRLQSQGPLRAQHFLPWYYIKKIRRKKITSCYVKKQQPCSITTRHLNLPFFFLFFPTTRLPNTSIFRLLKNLAMEPMYSSKAPIEVLLHVSQAMRFSFPLSIGLKLYEILRRMCLTHFINYNGYFCCYFDFRSSWQAK